MIKVSNGKLLIKQLVERTELGNGITITNETQSRKDTVSGMCLDGTLKGCKVYYPLYSANPITIDGENLIIIDERDILCWETK